MRSEFKKPFGKLYPSIEDAEEILKSSIQNGNPIISIGDVTTRNILEAEIIPDMGIVDNKIERRPSEDEIYYDNITLKTENPPGTITDDLWKTIEKAFQLMDSKHHVLITVNGEEDLAVIPCAIMAPSGSIILYGQPGEGVVLCEVDKIKKTAERLIKMLEEA
ncbi:MAG: DUF359 domain-containing protein [Methanobacterium aggregans]|nr:DUF359 domain-containing protein [Methanobacterium aggregans]